MKQQQFQIVQMKVIDYNMTKLQQGVKVDHFVYFQYGGHVQWIFEGLLLSLFETKVLLHFPYSGKSQQQFISRNTCNHEFGTQNDFHFQATLVHPPHCCRTDFSNNSINKLVVTYDITYGAWQCCSHHTARYFLKNFLNTLLSLFCFSLAQSVSSTFGVQSFPMSVFSEVM